MNLEQGTLSDVTQQMQTVLRQMEELTRTTVMWMVVSALLLVFLFVILFLLLRMRARNKKVENWLVKEVHTLQENQVAVYRMVQSMAQNTAARTAPAARKPAAQPPPQEETPSPAPAIQEQQPTQPREPLDMIATLNEMLAGNQPYNFVESIRAIEPRLNLQRLTPRANADVFDKEVVLELGGDGLFARVSGDEAELYPNYSRFSATLDPKPLFDGARHGGRIHSILQPAILRRQGEETWILVEKGRVQMRQGN